MPRTLQNHKQKIKNKHNPRRPQGRNGLRRELLTGDGKTFTLEMAMPASRIPKQMGTFTFVQSFTSQAFFTTSGAIPSYTFVNNTLSSIDQSASLVALFDQYRITEAEHWMVPQVSDAVSSATGILYSVVDLDDSTNLTSTAQFGDYQNCVTTPLKTGQYRHFQPHVAIAAYSGAFSSFANQPSPWLDTASTTVVHYGTKWGANVSSVAVTYDLYCRLKFEFRNIR